MRTKTLLLTAALAAAGALSSMAQSNVYSLNIVGYVNLTLSPGFNLVSTPLLASASDVNTVLTNQSPVVPANSLLYMWSPSQANYAQALTAGGDGFWYDQSFNLATNQVPPGTGFFV